MGVAAVVSRSPKRPELHSAGEDVFTRLLDFLTGREGPALEESPDVLQLSVAAPLIEAARMDSNFDAQSGP